MRKTLQARAIEGGVEMCAAIHPMAVRKTQALAS
jgi:hypothetical protein